MKKVIRKKVKKVGTLQPGSAKSVAASTEGETVLTLKKLTPVRLLRNQFYQKVFGLEPKSGFGGAIYMSDGDVNIALIEVKREDQKEGINHYGFEVDDLQSFTENLRAAGFPTEIDSKSDNDSDYRVQDPDGRWVDLAVKRRWPK